MGRDYYETIHHNNLIELLKPKGLLKIDELPDLVQFLMTEPKYFNQFPRENICPDAFISYKNGLWTVIELKHTMKSKDKAFRQIESGYELLHDVFNVKYDDIHGKIVTYEHRFDYKDFKSNKF